MRRSPARDSIHEEPQCQPQWCLTSAVFTASTILALAFIGPILFLHTVRMDRMDQHQAHLFDITGREGTTARTVHIRRLCDLLKVCTERGDIARARRAWDILCRCKEFKWKSKWRIGLLMLSYDESNNISTRVHNTQISFLRTMMLQFPEEVSSYYNHHTLKSAG